MPYLGGTCMEVPHILAYSLYTETTLIKPPFLNSRNEQLRGVGLIDRRYYGGRSMGGIWYFDIPSPNTTVFSALWPHSIALWGSSVPPYTMVVQYAAVTGT